MDKSGWKFGKEIREAIPPALFFLVVFHLIALTKAVTLGEYSFPALRATVATVGALIVAKAILVVEALPISKYFSRRLVLQILWKTLLFGLVAMIFRVVEESIELAPRHGAWLAGFDTLYAKVNWPAFGVLAAWLFSALLLYNVIVELVRAVGPNETRQLLFGVRDDARTRGQASAP